MLPYLQDGFGNANSLHAFGKRAEAAVALARERVAQLLGVEDPSQVTFTSGATESNNWVLSNWPGGYASPFEHSSIYEPAKRMGMRLLPNTDLTLGEPNERASLISVMTVNNELGTQWDVRKFRSHADVLHADITQQLGKLAMDLEGVDYASFSCHKLYGPKGIGGLYSADKPLEPFIMGGEQEGGRRGGTLNVPGIVGFGAAAAIAGDELRDDQCQAEELRGIVLESLGKLSDWRTNGGKLVSPYILNVSFLGVEGEALVIDLDNAGYAISSGAACSSHSTEPSHVLLAAGLDEKWRRGTVRISFGRFNNAESAVGLASSLIHSVEKLRTMTGTWKIDAT